MTRAIFEFNASAPIPECYTHSFVSQLRRYIFLPLCFLAGCANIPDSYAPPIQRKPLTGTEPSEVGHFVNLGDPAADAYIVRGVSSSAEAGSWRWTRKRAELRFFLDSTAHFNFKSNFSIADSTFQETGPVTISVYINDNLLDTIRCDAPGEKHIEKPVPEKFLRPKAVNLVAMEIDKVWVSKTDGAVLGFILTRAGFTQ